MKTNKLFLSSLCIVVLFSLFLSACQGTDTATAPPTTIPTILPPTATIPPSTATSLPPTEAPTQEPVPTTPPTPEQPVDATISRDLLLDPALATDPDSQMVNAYIYETLLRKDADGNLLPMLATSWVISDDRLDYIFELRPNVVFHDGTSLNADAVMTNFNRWFDPANPLHGDGSYDAWLAAFGGFLGELDENEEPKSSFDGIEKVNNLTVLIHLNRQDADFLSKMTELSFSFASPTAMQNAGAAYGTMEGGAAGTGAYTLSEWSEANLVLTPSASYWGTPASGNLVFGWK